MTPEATRMDHVEDGMHAGMMNRRAFVISALVGGYLATIAGPADAAIAANGKIGDLLARMTVAEKAGQLHMEAALSGRRADPAVAMFNPFLGPTTPAQAKAQFEEQLARIRAGGVGSLMTPMDVESLLLAQRAAVDQSRLGIPLLIAADIIHSDRTVFPVPLAEAASFDPELARRTARACAMEATARGLDVTFAPMVDIGRDQRWGRVVEGSGEDVLLAMRFAAARVLGFQGDIGTATSMLACVKHFVAYGAPESGLDYQGTSLSDRVLAEVYMAPFKAAFDAGAVLAMASFNTVDGVPATGNRRLLTDLLRGRLGFTGAVLSDFEGEKELVAHGQAEDERDAVRLALSAGCDVGMVSGLFPKYIPELVASGRISMDVLDKAVRRVLHVKQIAGLFDQPFRRLDVRRSRRPAPVAHHALAREAAVKSIVLLRNDGNLLPLKKAGQRIALIGPFGADVANIHGPWSTFTPDRPPVSLAAGLREAMDDPSMLQVVEGCGIEAEIPGGIDAATAAAASADVVILAVGESQEMSGESSSRDAIVVPAPQVALATALARTGKPVVVVLRNGRALALNGAIRDAPALVVSWFLGTENGHALADILFGQAAPSARLPVTFPRSSGQEPFYYAREISGRPAGKDELERFKSHFLGLPDSPLYPFGHGLTYGDISYGPTTITKGPDGFIATVEVSNAGRMDAVETVQLYVHQIASYVVQPRRKMIDFRKVTIAAGRTEVVRFIFGVDHLTHLGQDMQPVAGTGDFLVWLAGSATTGVPVRFGLASTGSARPS